MNTTDTTPAPKSQLRGPGRPQVGEATLKATVPAELLAAIDAAAGLADMTRAAWVRQALTDAVSADRDAILEQVAELQLAAYRKARGEAERGGLWPSTPENMIDLSEAAADSGTINLNDPDADWAVDVGRGDVVRVFAAGDVEAAAVIPGAWAWAEAAAAAAASDDE